MKIRQPAVAGHFYPGDKEGLQALMGQLLTQQTKIKDTFALIAPHAGYVYSGKTAGKTYSSVDIPDVVIIMSPNHTGLGYPISLHPAETWITPLGPIQADLEIINRIKKKIPDSAVEPSAQLREHALEVHLPFIQTLNPNARIVPITLALMNMDSITKLGVALSEIIMDTEKSQGFRPLIVASSDMTHFEDVKKAEKMDKMAIDQIKKLDTKGFVNVVEKEDISLCGIYPISVTMEAILHYSKFKKLTPKVELVDYSNSGEVTGDFSSVVAYAGMVMSF